MGGRTLRPQLLLIIIPLLLARWAFSPASVKPHRGEACSFYGGVGQKRISKEAA